MDGTNTDDAPTRVILDDRSNTATDVDSEVGELEPGTQLGRYIIRSIAGTGGMGQVYRALDPELGREVALKILEHPEDGSQGLAPASLVHEAQAMARLSHPNVVPVYDVETLGHRVFLVMEFVEGQTLKAWLGESERSVAEILRVFGEAGRGLAAAHEAGIVHRDFKPANVMVGRDGAVRVTDFGIAHTSDGGDSTRSDEHLSESSANANTKTQAGLVLGTPAYMSPEQHDGRPVDARSDQYSLCVALYEALQGERPFQAATVFEMAACKHAGPPHAVARAGVSSRVQRALRRGLAVEPTQRFPTIEALLVQLRVPTRRRLAWGAAAVVAGLGVGGITWAWSPVGSSPCEGAPDRLAEVWGEPQRQAIEAAMRTSGVSFATDSTARIHEALDRAGTAWVDAWTQTCRTPVSDAKRDHVMSCLARQHRELGAMVTALGEIDAKSAAEGVSAVWSLPDPSRCLAEADAGRGPEAPAEIAESIEQVREVLRRAAALRRLGRQPEALPLAQAQLPIATALGYAPLIAEVEIALGHIGVHHRVLDATELFESAYFRMMEAGILRSAGRAASELVYEYGEKRIDIDRALEWERHARAALEHTGARPEDLAELDNNFCAALMADARFPQARAACEHALELHEANDGPDHPRILAPLHNLAKLELELRRFDAAAPLAERALRIARDSYGPRHPWLSNTLNLMGAVTGQSGQHARALEYLREALEITRETSPHAAETIAIQLQNIAITHAISGDFDRARDSLQEALEFISTERGDSEFSLGPMRATLGRIHIDREDYAAARSELEAAVELMLPRYGDEHVEIARTRYELGRVAHAQGRLDDARTLFERLSERDPSTFPATTYAETLIWLAKVHMEQGRLKRVVGLLDQARAIEVEGPGVTLFLADVRFDFAKAAELHEVAEIRQRAITQARKALAEFGGLEDERAVERCKAIEEWLLART